MSVFLFSLGPLSVGDNNAGAVIKLVFREAKIHDAILFFDEAESIFMTRDSGSHRVGNILCYYPPLGLNGAHRSDASGYFIHPHMH
jgi:hypothetical protein